MRTGRIFVLLFAFALAKAEFDLQYLGDSLTDDEAQARVFCNTKYCIEDSQILFYAATQNTSVDPCLDFKEFSMGTLIRYRALHERYFAVGLQNDVKQLHEERIRKSLSAEVKKDDNRLFKILKNFFGKCVSSKNVRKNGRQGIIDHLKSLGGSPYLNGDSWDPEKFNVSRIIELEPRFGTLILLDFDFKGMSPDGRHNLPSLVKEGIYFMDTNEKSSYKHYNEMIADMEQLELQNASFRESAEIQIKKAVERLRNFDKELEKHKGESGSNLVKTKDIQELTSNLKVNWLQVINDQLLDEQKIKEDDDVVIVSPESLKSLATALETMDKATIADAFMLKYLYFHRFLFIVYPFDWRDASYSHNTRARQRWEQCIEFVKDKMRPAVEILLTTVNERDIKDVDEFIKSTVNDFTDMIRTANESILPKHIVEKTVEKLNKIEFLSGSFARNFNESSLDDYYHELTLKGDENLVESALAIEKFSKKVNNMYKNYFDDDSKISIDSASSSDLINYNTLTDTFSVSAIWTYYPWFHAERPRFFNQATLYTDLIAALKFQTVRYIGNVLFGDASGLQDALNEFDFAYDNYVKWEQSGHTDLLLGANRLTTKQLFWLALARARYRKQKAVPGIEGNDYDRTFFWFKSQNDPLEKFERFQEAYKCKKETVTETTSELTTEILSESTTESSIEKVSEQTTEKPTEKPSGLLGVLNSFFSG